MVTDSRIKPLQKRRLRQVATVLFVVTVGGTALILQSPPPGLPADAPADVFSAARARLHVQAIARVPHPLGSRAAPRVRAYIIAQLKALGFEPEIQRPRDFRLPEGEPALGTGPLRRDVQNIIARLRGTGPPAKKVLLLSAHYDSVPRGPGAGDNGSSVAAILESLRALRAGPQLERDVIILINDGEEVGLFGADVFFSEHPWAKDVGVVLNFDARGNSGSSYMFETSGGNGWLIEHLAHALPHPMATSLSIEVYRLMPNDTDLTVYKHYGMAGLNFAFVGGLYYYHSPEDTLENLDARTLQHQGENLLAMAQHLGHCDLDDVHRDDVTYTSLLERVVLIYPMAWVVPLGGCALLGYVGVLSLGSLKRRVRFLEIGAGFAVFLLAVIVVFLAVGTLWFALENVLSRMGLIVFRSDLGRDRDRIPVS